MVLEHIKNLAEKQAKIEITDCVITIPADFTIKQKSSLIYSAKLAGLSILCKNIKYFY